MHLVKGEHFCRLLYIWKEKEKNNLVDETMEVAGMLCIPPVYFFERLLKFVCILNGCKQSSKKWSFLSSGQTISSHMYGYNNGLYHEVKCVVFWYNLNLLQSLCSWAYITAFFVFMPQSNEGQVKMFGKCCQLRPTGGSSSSLDSSSSCTSETKETKEQGIRFQVKQTFLQHLHIYSPAGMYSICILMHSQLRK